MAVRGQRDKSEERVADSTEERERQRREQRRLEVRDRGEERRTWRTEDRVVERTNKNDTDLRRVVREVHAGFWGSSDALRGRLHRHGYDADEVAREVAKYRKVL